ncbi:MAG: hypothetical protein RL722_1085 [Pseudomonadota bacterium]|jgi:GntR family transcriptional regulator
MRELAALFAITPGSPEPIYRQLMGQVRRRATSGLWPAGTEMPSVRELALALALNPMTVSKAMSLLEAEGVLVRRRGLTMVIAEGVATKPHGGDATHMLRPTLARAVLEARQLGLSQDQALDLFKQAWREDANEE